MTALSLSVAAIRRDAGTQARVSLDEETVERYRFALDDLPPVTVYREDETTYWLADGWHRVEAHEREGRDMLTAEILDGTRRDAILHACGANETHGLPRTREDKRRAVSILLEDEEWSGQSDRWIAERCRVSHTFVAKMRRLADAPPLELGDPPPEPDPAPPASTTSKDIDHDWGIPEEPAAADGGGNVATPPRTTETEFQAPEPDNAVRTPVRKDARGKPLTEGDLAGIRALAETWTPDAVCERFRIQRFELDEILAEPPEESQATSDRLSQWWTPAELATLMVELAGVQPGETVLEPSAGGGAIVEALVAAGALVEAWELDPRWAEHLRGRWSRPQVEAFEGDYLTAPPADLMPGTKWAFKRAVINPPYENGLDGRFLARALDECEVVVALTRLNILCGQGRGETVWKAHGGRCRRIHPLVARPDFNDDSRDNSGAKSDFVILEFDGVDRGPDAPLRHIFDRFGGRS